MDKRDLKVLKFVELTEYLYRNCWIHFKLSDEGWTKGHQGDDKIFGIIIRTLICNDDSSRKFFEEIGGYKGIITMYDKKIDFIGWLNQLLNGIKMGLGQGSHRDERHKRWTAQAIKEYLELTNFNQRDYFDKIKRYNDMYNDLISLHGNGPLTAFDLTKRLYEAGVIDLLPDRFYLTGSGEIKGIKALYPGVSETELLIKGNELVKTIRERTGIPEEVLHFGVEDLLCIYQKNNRYNEFLKCKISVSDFGLTLLNMSCTRERGVC